MKSIPAIALVSLLPTALSYAPNPAIGLAAKGMGLLKPVFKLEAEIQAAALGGKIDKDDVVAEINNLKSENKALIYTYGLSPFSTEARNILKATDYQFTEIELGAEWFLLGGKESVTRVALSEEVEGGATSLPKIFIGGNALVDAVNLLPRLPTVVSWIPSCPRLGCPRMENLLHRRRVGCSHSSTKSPLYPGC